MFQVSVEETFAAAHFLRHHGGSWERLHGHNYRVVVTVVGPKLNGNGLLMGFAELKRMVKDVIGRSDHRFLNEVPPFDALNPSAENIAKRFCDEISMRLPEECRVRVGEVKVWETDANSVSYRNGNRSQGRPPSR